MKEFPGLLGKLSHSLSSLSPNQKEFLIMLGFLELGEGWCKHFYGHHSWDCAGSSLRAAQYWVLSKANGYDYLATTDV